jgi:hypothetical protein
MAATIIFEKNHLPAFQQANGWTVWFSIFGYWKNSFL